MTVLRPASWLVLLLLLFAALPPGLAQTKTEDMTTIQLPSNPVSDFAAYYQTITGKRIIADATLAAGGQNLSLVVADPVSKEEAAELIKSVLALNGFTIVTVDDQTVKLLGPAKRPVSESVPLYTSPSQLPPGDEMVSYFMPFRYLKSEEAAAAFANYAPNHPAGSYVQVPSVNAMVLTDTASLVRRLISLKDVIDVEVARTATKFFSLQRADAEKVAEILQKLFEKNDDGSVARTAPANPAVPNGNPANPGSPGAAPTNGAPVLSGPAPKVQIFADKRTNRVMVVAPEGQMEYIQMVVQSLDVAVGFDEVLDRPLRFVRAGTVLPVLANLLAENTGKDGQAQKPEIIGDDSRDNPNGGGESGGSSDSGSSGGATGSSGTTLTEKTSFSSESTNPQAAIVGNSRIIADRSVNKILVFGPPEARAKAARFLDLLDQRPKQVYLACVIGQLTLTNNAEFGINYLLKFGSVRFLGQGTTGNIQNLLANRSATLDTAVSTATTAATAVASNALPALAGLTVFGAIADGVDIVARALSETGRFQIISRPFICTANGQGAVISSGQEIPVATGSQSFVTDVNSNTNAGGSFNTSIEYKKVVLELDVRPLINSDDEVTLNIRQKNDNNSGNVTVGNNQVPVINTQNLSTTISVRNRHTVVLGGLISDQEERSQTGIPFLKDIPGIGYIFGTTTKNKTRRELIIMIQPFIVNSDAAQEEVNYIERANTNFREHMFDESVPVKPATLPAPEDLTNPKLFR